jgi:hypothetical protein
VIVLRPEDDPLLARSAFRQLQHRVARHGFDGHVIAVVDTLPHAIAKAVAADDPSLLIVDDPGFDAPSPGVPIVVIDDGNGSNGSRVIGSDDDTAAIGQRLASGRRNGRLSRSRGR